VHVTIIGGRTGRNRAGIRVHQTAVLDRRDVRRHQRLPVTAPARTLLEIAPGVSDCELERAVDEALSRRLTSRTAIRDMLRRHPGRPGAPRLRALAADVRPSTVTRSDAEERLLALVRRAGLPMPECNATLGDYRPDLLWRDQRVIVELDGYPFHRGRSSFEGDRRRDNELRGAGFQTIRVTRRQVDEEPERVLVWLATALARGTR
jgi:very-short-patch-repair endonuclease